MEIPLGAALTSSGFRSAGSLVNYGPLSAGLTSPDKLRYNGIHEVTASVIQYVSQNAGVVIEKHYIAPEGVLRVRGWNASTQTPINWQGAAETLVEVYEPSDYTVATHTFSGQPHSYYRLEVASGNGLQPGVRVVQSSFGVETTQTMQASGDGLLLRDADGSTVTETQVIPPALGETLWQRQITVNRDAVVTSSVLETHKLQAGRYVLASESVDPGPAAGDELVTEYSYYDDGRMRSASKNDGSWSFNTYNGESTTTYGPWLSESSLVYANSEWSLPSTGLAVKTVSSDSATSPSSSSSIVELSSEWEITVATLSSNYTSVDTYSNEGYKRTTRFEERGDWVTLTSYSLAHADNSSNPLLAGREAMCWDSTGRATLYQYEKGNWAAPVFTPDANGSAIRTSTYAGYIASPDSYPVESDFTHVPSHSTKEVTITTALGVVREETHVCVSVGNYQLAVAKNHEYEPDGQFRRTGTKINGVYVSKTEYLSPTITREWSEDGTMTETVTDSDGQVASRTTSGDATVPAVTTEFDHTGLTSTTTVNNQTVSIETTDRLGRTIFSEDATGAETFTAYDDGNRTTTRTAPGGVTTIDSRHFDGQPISTTGSGVIAQYYDYSVDENTQLVVTTTTVGAAGGPRVTSTSRYWDGSTATETSPDPSGAGTITLTYEYASTSSTPLRVYSSAANTADRIQLDPASSAEAAMGHYSLSGMETDGNGPVIAGTDRLTETSTSYVFSGGVWNRQTVARSFHTGGSSASYSQTSLQALAPVAVSDGTYGSGLRWTSSTTHGTTTVSSHRDFFFDGIASIDSTEDTATTASLDSKSISRFGRAIFSSSYGSTAGESMTYDASGRLYQQTSATGAITTYGYNAVGQLETITDHEGKTTTHYYHPNNHANAGLLWQSINPAQEVTETLYNPRGQVTETTGTGTYRVTRGYNTYGEMDSMRTYRTTGSAGDLTQWTYDPATGVLKEKTDAASKKTIYTYYPNGLLFTRTWARPGTIKATYTYNAFGDLTFTNYSDTTPDVTITPDRLGRPVTITDASGTRTFAYHSVTGATDLVTYGSGGLLPTIQIDYTLDTSQRPSGYSISGGGPSSVLGYDTAGRLSTVTAAGNIHTHGYINGTGTPANLTTTSGGSTVLTRTLHHDRMGRLRGIATANASGTHLSRHGYILDDAGRRKTATRENGQRWDYGYDTLGQVTSAVKRFPDEAAIPGHTFGYAYDGIGNRTSATQGGTGTLVTYPPASTNSLNQYTTINTEGGRFILGEAPTANAVTVNNLTTSRAGGLGFFWKQLSANNASVPVWSNDSVISNGVTVTGRTWTPAASVTPAYDFDGNLTSDGRWDYLWDAENRLIQMKSTAAALAAATASGIPAQKLDFVYDAQSRRVSKTVSTSTNGTTWTFLSNQRFLYDGWNMIAEYSAPSATSTTLTLQATHTWGIDLSGTPQGAGGVGGLLATHLVAVPASSCYPAYDGNGNISAWIDATGTLLARMDYSPFGQLIAQYKFTPAGSTTLSRLAFGFSTKYSDVESGLLYYGYRYYDPVIGRWVARDPIEEDGGMNLNGFVGNDSLMLFDFLGLDSKWFADGHIPERVNETDPAYKIRLPNGGTVVRLPNGKIGMRDWTFVLDGSGGYVIDEPNPKQNGAQVPAAINHENRHIESVKSDSNSGAIPNKQVFCLKYQNGSIKRFYYIWDAGKKSLVLTAFGDKESMLLSRGTAVLFTTHEHANAEEKRETELEISELSKMNNPSNLVIKRINRLNQRLIAISQYTDKGDTPEWSAFKKAYEIAKLKAKENKADFSWKEESKVYKEIK